MRRGKFITFEGLDGSGKSTQQKKLAAALQREGYRVLRTREPGGTETGERIRKILLDSATAGLASLAEMALMFASRAQHIAQVIEPGLVQGYVVLCDRFTDSTEAYQGGGRKLGSKVVLDLHRILCRGLRPDLTVLLDFHPGMSLGRARRRNRQVAKSGKHEDESRFELENQAFFLRVREAYLEIAKREPDRVVVIDAHGTPAQTHRKIMEAVHNRLKLV